MATRKCARGRLVFLGVSSELFLMVAYFDVRYVIRNWMYAC
jgi:hypothetical protein